MRVEFISSLLLFAASAFASQNEGRALGAIYSDAVPWTSAPLGKDNLFDNHVQARHAHISKGSKGTNKSKGSKGSKGSTEGSSKDYSESSSSTDEPPTESTSADTPSTESSEGT